jgi:preprotein translocase subunit Sec61beta
MERKKILQKPTQARYMGAFVGVLIAAIVLFVLIPMLYIYLK